MFAFTEHYFLRHEVIAFHLHHVHFTMWTEYYFKYTQAILFAFQEKLSTRPTEFCVSIFGYLCILPQNSVYKILYELY